MSARCGVPGFLSLRIFWQAELRKHEAGKSCGVPGHLALIGWLVRDGMDAGPGGPEQNVAAL